MWDFAWEYGESLTSRPARGADLRGRWDDSSDGSGRVSPHNGQLTLDSGPNRNGLGDHGTSRATLRDNPMRLGRWETKLRLSSLETGAGDYHAVVELVPDRAADDDGGARTITVADLPVGGSGVDIGVRSPDGRQWTATRPLSLGTSSGNFGFEVAQDHLTWFVDGRPVVTLKNRAAVPTAPMTLRLSLVGQGIREMDHTLVYSDWQRGWTLDRGTRVTSGAGLQPGTFTPSC